MGINRTFSEEYLPVDDEPATNLMFGFEQLATHLYNVITNPKTVTPFTIAVHGEWGSGKTTLIDAVYEKAKKTLNHNWKVLKFDAWEYERTDVVAALLQQITSTYKLRDTSEFAKAVVSLVTDVALRKFGGISTEEAKNHFKDFIKQIPTIRKKLESLTNGNRLIVLVDDLDRCNVENVLDMLEAIKMFLAAKGVIFVIAVDVDKIERAWQLRYGNTRGTFEGMEHVEKIFQVKLSLPPKNSEDIDKFLSSIFPDLPNKKKRQIIELCNPNPRKIKRLLNLVYFVLMGLFEYEDNHGMIVESTISWCALILFFPNLARAIKHDPKSLFYISAVCKHYDNLSNLQSAKGNLASRKKPTWNFPSKHSQNILNPNVLHGIETISINNDYAAFEFLVAFATYYGSRMSTNQEERWRESLFESMECLIPCFDDIVNGVGFVGG